MPAMGVGGARRRWSMAAYLPALVLACFSILFGCTRASRMISSEWPPDGDAQHEIVERAEDLVSAIEAGVPHVVITAHMELTMLQERSVNAPVLALNGTASLQGNCSGTVPAVAEGTMPLRAPADRQCVLLLNRPLLAIGTGTQGLWVHNLYLRATRSAPTPAMGLVRIVGQASTVLYMSSMTFQGDGDVDIQGLVVESSHASALVLGCSFMDLDSKRAPVLSSAGHVAFHTSSFEDNAGEADHSTLLLLNADQAALQMTNCSIPNSNRIDHVVGWNGEGFAHVFSDDPSLSVFYTSNGNSVEPSPLSTLPPGKFLTYADPWLVQVQRAAGVVPFSMAGGPYHGVPQSELDDEAQQTDSFSNVPASDMLHNLDDNSVAPVGMYIAVVVSVLLVIVAVVASVLLVRQRQARARAGWARDVEAVPSVEQLKSTPGSVFVDSVELSGEPLVMSHEQALHRMSDESTTGSNASAADSPNMVCVVPSQAGSPNHASSQLVLTNNPLMALSVEHASSAPLQTPGATPPQSVQPVSISSSSDTALANLSSPYTNSAARGRHRLMLSKAAVECSLHHATCRVSSWRGSQTGDAAVQSARAHARPTGDNVEHRHESIGTWSSVAKRVSEELDEMCAYRVPLFGEYRVLGATDRRVSEQSLVQFCVGPVDVAVKFFANRVVFERERAVLEHEALRDVAPPCWHACANEDGRFRSASGFVFPPFIVLERGQGLHEIAMQMHNERITVIHALCVIAAKVAALHTAGWVHRDLKPSNIVRMPRAHTWVLIDFDSAALMEEPTGMSFTLAYAAPEVIKAYEAGDIIFTPSAAQDVWALGMIAFELLTKSRVFPPGTPSAEIVDALAGRTSLPWELSAERNAPQGRMKLLRRLKPSILQCLRREPALRPDASSLLASWTNMFEGHPNSEQGHKLHTVS